MEGEITSNKPDSGNIDKVRFYVCPSCGRKLERVLPMDATVAAKITVEEMDTDYFIIFDHPMTKEHYISFVAFVKSDKVLLKRLYPEQSPTCRFPITIGGKLYVYCSNHGLVVYENL